jgi:adenosylcobyric acid synthase
MSARAVMVLGTGSHVGKSLLTTALCRIFKQDGLRVAPFKAQNMSLNSAATPEGGEIGRAQALQAEAAGIAPTVDMNPILLRPTSDRRSQVIVRGKISEDLDALTYHRTRVSELFPLVCESYERLAARFDVIVLEGAGSPAEINLRDGDIVNMRMAHAANARCLLVGDIDRGGIFASLYGTLALLEERDRARIAGVVVNKFRGELALFASGVAMLEDRIAKPCFGVVPWLHDIGLEEEDGVSFDDVPRATQPQWRDAENACRRTRVCVVAWPHLANVTDFDALGQEPSVELVYAAAPAALSGADLVVLPGTKSTLAALRWLDERGFVPALAAASLAGFVLGICGGMQALGSHVADPFGIEGGGESPGLGLLPLHTTLARDKVAERVRGRTTARIFGIPIGSEITGYEIHVGATTYDASAARFAWIVRESDGFGLDDGAVALSGRVAGTYCHGLFADDEFRHAALRGIRAARGLAPATSYARVAADREARFDRLAAHVRAAVDIRAVRGDAVDA